jgi:GNAT superfamily N-acetyltransferase
VPESNDRVVVRPLVAGDLAECVRVLAEVHQRDGYPVHWPDRADDWLSRASGLGAWVAELDGRLAGHIGLGRNRESDLAPTVWSDRHGLAPDRTAVVSRLFVAARARGRGIGARLVDQAVAEARRRDLHPVLDVVASDAAAVALYERLGWELMATVERQWDELTVAIHCYAAGGSDGHRAS